MDVFSTWDHLSNHMHMSMYLGTVRHGRYIIWRPIA
jgi:hypothetical protein